MNQRQISKLYYTGVYFGQMLALDKRKLGPNQSPLTYFNFYKTPLEKLFLCISFYCRKGPPDLQELATSRFEICMRDAVVRCVPYPRSQCTGTCISRP
jgi:hypothetical protein